MHWCWWRRSTDGGAGCDGGSSGGSTDAGSIVWVNDRQSKVQLFSPLSVNFLELPFFASLVALVAEEVRNGDLKRISQRLSNCSKVQLNPSDGCVRCDLCGEGLLEGFCQEFEV